jgi:hypothetical protein
VERAKVERVKVETMVETMGIETAFSVWEIKHDYATVMA